MTMGSNDGNYTAVKMASAGKLGQKAGSTGAMGYISQLDLSKINRPSTPKVGLASAGAQSTPTTNTVSTPAAINTADVNLPSNTLPSGTIGTGQMTPAMQDAYTNKTNAEATMQSWSPYLQGAQAVIGLGNLGLGYQNYLQSKKQFNMERDLANINLANQTKQYNNALDDRTGVGLAFKGGTWSPEQAAAYQAEQNKQRLADARV